MEKKKLYIIPNQHMDLVWRRCFDRDLEFDGQNFVSYADIEQIYIDDSIALCEKYPFYRFSVECVAVLDKYLQRNPEKEEKIGQLIREGRLYVPFTGNNIVDTNLVSGESIVRNYLQGYHYLKKRFSHIPDGADRNDAFGNCAQLPQILRKFGTRWVYHISYTPCEKPYWRGLDGSTVYDLEPVSAGTVGGYPKYPPCPVCKGYKEIPCNACGGRRVDQKHMDRRKFQLVLNEELVFANDEPCYVLAGGEEVAPMEKIALWAMENKDRYDIEFTNFETYKQYRKAQIDAVDNPPGELVQESPECNCNNTGVYVSRIQVKQKFRKLEHSIFAAETLAVSDYLQGRPYPIQKFEKIWEKALFTMFHDAITSTHADAGYEEVMDTLDAAQTAVDDLLGEQDRLREDDFRVVNPTGLPVSGVCRVTVKKDHTVADAAIISVSEMGESRKIEFFAEEIAPYGAKTYRIIPENGGKQPLVLFAAEDGVMTGDAVLNNTSNQQALSQSRSEAVVMENECYRIIASEQGVAEIFDKRLGMAVAKESSCLIGEWILETDIGSPWATLSTDMRRISLRKYTKLVRHERTADTQTVTYEITPDVRNGFAETCFRIRYSVSLVRGVEQVLFSADVNWDTYDHRLRIAFPTTLQGRHLYDVPYGMLERKPYDNDIVLPDGDSNWASAAGDYPAIHWAGIDGENSVALFNRGTPSYQIDKDAMGAETIYLSVLRSPTMPTCLHAAADYTMTAYDGMRDAGQHHFDYALKSYAGNLADSSVHADGISYNTRLVVTDADAKPLMLPALISDNAWISSVALARDGKNIIVRVAEYRGREGKYGMHLPEQVKQVLETDLKEDPFATLPLEQSEICGTVKPFEIKTFCLMI